MRPLPLVLLAACLALLATTITLGVCYWQQGEHLEQDQAELMRMQQEGNCSQTKLQKMRGELEHAQQLVQKLQQQLDRAQATVQSCQVTDCYLETWMLHGGKCLFLSREKTCLEGQKESDAWQEQAGEGREQGGDTARVVAGLVLEEPVTPSQWSGQHLGRAWRVEVTCGGTWGS
ncbi:hypothetical protein Y1Q_0012303 [Alligator mississippiensis]|uniref:Uncharacterized protein n=1 Tax=Alligator mississippiensis TaxID=8496 RepID=A0A151NKH7_ALLMI|nr:hypothetical protein Y1Q_0012303 [Alligator mississippiensis]